MYFYVYYALFIDNSCNLTENKSMFEAFVLACLWGQPQLPQYCEELQDTRGPYVTKDKCLARVYEIAMEMPSHRPHMQPRAYRCDKPTTQTNKKRT